MTSESRQGDCSGSAPRSVVVLAFDDVIAFDLATPVEVFRQARLHNGRPAYQVLVAAATGTVRAGPVNLHVPHGLDVLERADTVVIPGSDEPERPLPADICHALRRAHERGARLASICVGAFWLAATGLLDGHRATTHWRATERLAALYPRITVEPNVLFVDNGSLLTSAGAAAGLDLCLYLIGRDHGAAAAADAARAAVAPLGRSGGQAQYIDRRSPRQADQSLAPLLLWIEDHANEPLTLQDIASQARMSTRTLNRRFLQEQNTTPMQWLTRTRIRHAEALLEITSYPVDTVAHTVGFGSPGHFRTTFTAAVGATPAQYRRTFNAQHQP